ncbi:hypothetical protein ACQPZP_40685 [Spirillospora sp. CA-142024]|uniref:hypothetical protein n=1 Tax=Spirillospora sp. CA-142024 TaxID=3240036 RepID=UPI003D8F6E02
MKPTHIFTSWNAYNAAVPEPFRYDTERNPWPLEYLGDTQGIENDIDPEAGQGPLRVLYLPHGFAHDETFDHLHGNVVACGWVWQPPVVLLASDLPFAAARRLCTARPGTLGKLLGVLREAAG